MRHGGDVISYAEHYNGEIIDFSSNINPLGAPKTLKKKLFSDFNNVLKYPDIKYRELKEEISEYLGCTACEVIVGNGAVEIIDNICRMFKRVIVAAPCFSEYLERAEVNKIQLIITRRREDFEIDFPSISKVIKEGDLLILGNPNNPTGKRIGREVLEDIYDLVNKRNAFLLIDEAFFEFCPDDYDSIKLFYGKNNVCIIRAATKFFALPGIRLGYAYTSSEVVKNYDNYCLPWSVNSFAERAGREIFKEEEYIRESKEYISRQRNYLLNSLRNINYLKVFDSDCNFILLKLINFEEEELFNFLLKRGILIRRASSFQGLDESYVRIAVKDNKSNKKLIKLLKEFEKWKL